jgi:protein-S-isoprenylcysteine O-methyltransferase Ste14
LASDEAIVLSAPVRHLASAQDIVGRGLLITLMVFIAQGCWGRMAGLSDFLTATRFLDFLSELGTFAFATLVGILTMIRLPPCRRDTRWGATMSALGGAFILTVIIHLPNSPLPFGIRLLSVSLLAVGNIGTVYCLAHLGRSFSVLPQARSLVRSGPYAYLRHPLYVAEGIATIGMILPHFGWAALGICLTQFALQWNRIRYEETVLRAAFADYAAYAATTPRFVPRWKRGAAPRA